MTAPPISTRSNNISNPGNEQYQDHDQHATAAPPAAEDEQRFSLSATQIMASMSAAVTAAMVGSTLGVAGTVIGAGLASVISVVGGAVFGHSILLTRKQVKRAVLQVRGADRESTDSWEPADHGTPEDDLTVVIPAVTPTRAALNGPERTEPRRPRPTRRRLGAGLLVGVAAAAAIFAGSLAAVTLVETVKGSPLSGGDSGGLSVLGGTSGTDSEPMGDAPATTPQVTELSTVTQTVTSEPTDTAPATSEQPTTASSAPSSTPQATASSAPSSSAPSPSQSSASAPSPTATGAPSTAGSADAR